MAFSSQTTTLIVVVAVLFIIYFIYSRNSAVSSQEEVSRLPSNEERLENFEGEEDKIGDEDNVSQDQAVPRDDMIQYFPQKDYAAPESDWLRGKFDGRNRAKRGFKRVSYSAGLRGDLGPSEWENYFDHNNNVVGNSQTGDNDKFLPIDESNGGLAVFKSQGRATCGSNQNCDPEDLFDVDKYLPQEVNDDWFEVQPEPISVKNRHLINITKPIGVNTIGSSLKNASWDIRAEPAAPKMVVSPWLQSSIEPNVNIKPLM